MALVRIRCRSCITKFFITMGEDMKLKGKLLTKEIGFGWVEIEITTDEVLAQISEKEKFNLAHKLLVKPTKRRE